MKISQFLPSLGKGQKRLQEKRRKKRDTLVFIDFVFLLHRINWESWLIFSIEYVEQFLAGPIARGIHYLFPNAEIKAPIWYRCANPVDVDDDLY